MKISAWCICPSSCPPGDYFGANRPGNNLFGETLVAVDLETGKRELALSTGASRALGYGHSVRADAYRHHVDGRTIKAVAQPTKQAHLYVFDRATGQPVWPIEETPVSERRRAGRVVFAHAAVPYASRQPMIARASRSTI